MQKSTVRNVGLALASGLGGVAAYIYVARPRMMRWGATDAETRRVLPGDTLVPNPRHKDTHAITIHAPIAEVWSWLVQIGQDKGGFYSYSALENLVGCALHNTDRILPEFQTLKQGDALRLHPKAPPLIAEIVEPNHAVVFANPRDPRTNECNGSWAFSLKEIAPNTTRLLIRSRWNWNADFLSWFGYRCLLEPLHFLMERKMMLTLKALAERN